MFDAKHATREWVKNSDARIARREDELLRKLLDAAFDVLHHDTAEGSVGGDYERATLHKKFGKILFGNQWGRRS